MTDMNQVKNALAAGAPYQDILAGLEQLLVDANTNMGQGEVWLQDLYNATSVESGSETAIWIFNPWQEVFDAINRTLHAIHQINGGEAPGTPPIMYYSGT